MSSRLDSQSTGSMYEDKGNTCLLLILDPMETLKSSPRVATCTRVDVHPDYLSREEERSMSIHMIYQELSKRSMSIQII